MDNTPNPTVEFLSWCKEITNRCNDFETVSPDVPPHYDPLHFRFNEDSPCYAPSLVSSSINAAESLMTKYEETASQLQLLQSNLQKQIQSLQLWTENQKSLIAPIRSLSPDLIDLIMEHAISPVVHEYFSYDPAMYFSHVCSTWRSQALNHRYLWANFTIYVIPIPNQREMHHILDRMDTFFSRSDPLPLYLTIDDSGGPLTRREEIFDLDWDTIMPPILESLLRVSDRLRCLDVLNTFLYPDVFPKMDFPLLRSLSVVDTRRTMSSFTMPRGNFDAIILGSPQLRKFILDDIPCRWEASKIPWETVEYLEVAPRFMLNIPGHSLMNLGTLRLVGDLRSVPGVPRTPLKLPLLHDLRTKDLPFLEHLETPQLITFCMLDDDHVHLRPRIGHTIQKFLRSSGCSTQLTHLTLFIVPTDIPDVINLLEVVTGLRSLYLKAQVKDQDRDEDSEDDEKPQVDIDNSEVINATNTVYPRFIMEYLDGFTELFKFMTHSFPDSELDTTSSSPVALPNLVFLYIRGPRLFQKQFLTMIQSRCHPPHKLLRLELRLCKFSDLLTSEEVTSLLQDWDGIRDDLFQLKKDGRMDVRTYNSG